MSDRIARFVWKLSRRHTWGSPVPASDLVDLVVRNEDHDEMREILLTEVLELPFVVRSSDGISIPNGQDAHVQAANWLRENTTFSDGQIAATLSRLPNDWPRDE